MTADRELAAHLAIALTRYLVDARRDGVHPPSSLADLRDALVEVARSGQETTPRDVAAAAVEHARMSYSLTEAADLSGLSVRSIQRRIAAGDLPVTRVGRRVLVPRESLEALVGGR